MVRTPLGILAKPAPLADVFTSQEPVALLHQCAKSAVALGHDVMRLSHLARSNADLAALHQRIHFGARRNQRAGG